MGKTFNPIKRKQKLHNDGLFFLVIPDITPVESDDIALMISREVCVPVYSFLKRHNDTIIAAFFVKTELKEDYIACCKAWIFVQKHEPRATYDMKLRSREWYWLTTMARVVAVQPLPDGDFIGSWRNPSIYFDLEKDRRWTKRSDSEVKRIARNDMVFRFDSPAVVVEKERVIRHVKKKNDWRKLWNH